MPLSRGLLLLFANISTVARALILQQPQSTSIAEDARLAVGWSPKPTEAPKPQLLGAIPQHELFGRQETANNATCGWYDGDPNQPITCAHSTDGCGYYQSSPGGFGCCRYIGGSAAHTACPYVSACLNQGDPGNTFTGDGVAWLPPMIACPTALPSCITTMLFGSDGSTYYQFGCGATGTTLTAYQTTNEARTVVSVSTQIVRFTASTTSVDATTSSVSTSTAASSSTSSQADSPSSGQSSGSSTNLAVGVGVGVGVGCLILGFAAGFYCLRRHKAKAQAESKQLPPFTGFAAAPWTGTPPVWHGYGQGSQQHIPPSHSELGSKTPQVSELSGYHRPRELHAP